ncbi:MAG: NUDIX domain-containing protein [Anaerolineales bacterium]
MGQNARASVIEAAGGLLWRENEGGRELAIVHRVEHDDWCLPKGKRSSGEDWETTALREVLEETGYHAKIEAFAGTLTYTVEETPKVVLFWHMTPVKHDQSAMNGETDQVMWVSEEEVLKKLDYEDEKELIHFELKARKGGT